jgi:hypothetical protein
LRVDFEAEGLPSSAKFEIEPLMGEISPCFVDEDGSADEDGSSDFISTSPSFLASGLSSCCCTYQPRFKLK